MTAGEIEIVLLCILAVIVAGGLVGCSQTDSGDLEKAEPMSAKTIEEVQEEHTDEWMAIDGVEGTAIGLHEGKPCIKIFTSSKPEDVQAKIPAEVQGYPVVVEQTGTFRALEQ